MTAKGVSSEARSGLARLTARGTRFVTADAAAGTLGIDKASATLKLNRWASAGWLRRVRRGLYIPIPVDAEDPARWTEDPLILADEVWRPCYITGWTAANHWALTDQVFRTTVVKTTARIRKRTDRLLEHEYLLAHAREGELAWGLATVWSSDRKLRMADPARTIVDILDDPRLGGGIRHVAEMLSVFLESHDSMTLIDYGDRTGNRAIFKRLAYLLWSSRANAPDLEAACRNRKSAGMPLLDPSAPVTGPYSRHWGLRLNVTIRPEDVS